MVASPLSSDGRVRALGGGAGALEALGRDLGRRAAEQAAQLALVRREHRRLRCARRAAPAGRRARTGRRRRAAAAGRRRPARARAAAPRRRGRGRGRAATALSCAACSKSGASGRARPNWPSSPGTVTVMTSRNGFSPPAPSGSAQCTRPAPPRRAAMAAMWAAPVHAAASRRRPARCRPSACGRASPWGTISSPIASSVSSHTSGSWSQSAGMPMGTIDDLAARARRPGVTKWPTLAACSVTVRSAVDGRSVHGAGARRRRRSRCRR